MASSVEADGRVYKLAKAKSHADKLRAAEAVYALVDAEENRNALFNAGVLTVILNILNGDVQDNLRATLAGILGKLVFREDFRERFVNEGGLEALVSLAGSKDTVTQERSAVAIADLADSSDLRSKIIQLVVQPLLFLSSSSHEPVQEEAARAFQSLSCDELSRSVIGQQGGILHLVSLLNSKNRRVLERAAIALAMLSETPSNRILILQHHGVKAMARTARRGGDSGLLEGWVATAFENLSTAADARRVFVEDGALAYLLNSLQLPREEVRKPTVSAIANITGYEMYRSKPPRLGNLQPIFAFVSSMIEKDDLPDSCMEELMQAAMELYRVASLTAEKKDIMVLSYENGNKYAGEVDYANKKDAKRHGHGELGYLNGDKYVGDWHLDHQQGFGVHHYADGSKYYGMWKAGKKHGRGTVLYPDGTCFEGEWVGDKKDGKGTLTTVSGDTIEGSWKDENIKDAVFRKGAIKSAGKCAQQLANVELKAAFKRHECSEVIFMGKWEGMFQQLKYSDLTRSLDEDCLKHCKASQVSAFLRKTLSSSTHPFGILLQRFADYFHAGYHPPADAARQLPVAVDDAHSFVGSYARLILSHLKPIEQKLPRRATESIQTAIKATLFPNINSTFRSLYRQNFKERDSALSMKLSALRGVTPSDMGIKKEYWSVSGEAWAKAESADDRTHFMNAINVLRNVSECKDPAQKLECLMNASNAIVSAAAANWETWGSNRSSADDLLMGADDKFPIFVYVLIKSDIPYLYSEYSFISEFVEPRIKADSEYGYRLIELEAAMDYIESLDWHVRDENGQLMPLSQLEQRVQAALMSIEQSFCSNKQVPPPMIWLSDVLFHLGSRYRNPYAPYNLDVNNDIIRAHQKLIQEAVLSPIGLRLLESKSSMYLSFERQYPLYVYSRLASAIEKSLE